MTDLIERMRYHSATLDRSLFMEAADRIEALEAALRKIEDTRFFSSTDGPEVRLSVVYKIVRAALDQDAGK